MITKSTAFNRATRSFPKTMDIRKRKHTSIGGQYLKALIDEIEEVGNAIEEHRKSFFAYNYVGKEDTVIAYVKEAVVGLVNLEQFTLLEPALPVTTDAKLFNKQRKDYAYYEEGTIVICDTERTSILYKLGEDTYSARLNEMHIWNVFDEFALYNGLERHDGESNAALLNRCILSYKNVTNSTKEGLINAVYNEVSQVSDIEKSDIKIEKVGSGNINLPTIDGTPVSEVISLTDADSFRSKVWDKNKWNHPFKELEFSSVLWGQDIDNKQVGTGHFDLKTSLVQELKEDEETDVRIDVYNHSKERIEQYLKSNYIKTKIPLNVLKYEDEIDPIDVNFRIIAERMMDISNEEIFMELYERRSGEMTVAIEEVAVDRYDKEYDVVDGGLLEAGEYKLVFTPKSKYSKMHISEFKLDGANLLTEKPGFRLFEDKAFSDSYFFHGDKREEFLHATNIRNVSNGITLESAEELGGLALDVLDVANQYVRYEVESKHTDITFNNMYVTSEEFERVDGEWRSSRNNSSITIAGMFSELSFTLARGNFGLHTTIDGEYKFTLSNGRNTIEHKFTEPKYVEIRLERMNGSLEAAVQKITYAHYDLKFNLSVGAMLQTPQGMAIPEDFSGAKSRYLNITMQTFTGFSPVLKYVYIGNSLVNQKYESDAFVTDGTKVLSVETSCDIELINITTSERTKNYSTANRYVNNTNEIVYLQVDSSLFSSIRKSSPVLEPIVYKEESGFFIRIKPGESISSLYIEGDLMYLKARKDIVRSIKTSIDDKVYISRNAGAFIVEKNGVSKQVKIDRSFVDDEGFIKIVTSNSDIQPVFITDGTNEKETLSNQISNFEEMFAVPKESSTHVAYNKEKVFSSLTQNVEITDTFYPMREPNVLYHYVIDKGSREGIDVVFANGKSWSVREELLTIRASEDLVNDNFVRQDVVIENEFTLSDSMELDTYISVGGEEDLLSRYYIKAPEGYSVTYRTESDVTESMYVHVNRYNKMSVSNIEKIHSITKSDGTVIPASAYSLIKEYGIIHWQSDDYAGELVTVYYNYGIPVYLRVEDINILYTLLGYEVEAYEHVGTIEYFNLTRGMMLLKGERDIVNESDYVISQSSNPLIRVSVENGSIVLNKSRLSMDENYVVVDPGYYYVSQKEWYMFVDPKEEEVENKTGVSIEDAFRLNDEIVLHEKTSNLLKNTSMYSNDLRKVLEVDLTQHNVKENNIISRITASDSYHEWKLFDMDMAFVKGLNGDGIRFSSFSKESYALLDLSDYDTRGSTFSCYADRTLDVYLVEQETSIETKAVFGQKLKRLERSDDIARIDITSEKCGILVIGNGVIDDLVLTKTESYDASIHIKNIDEAGFVLDEPIEESYKRLLFFDSKHNDLYRTEVSSEGQIRTSTTMDWGQTRVHSYKDNWYNSSRSRVLIKKGVLKTEDLRGTIELETIHLEKIRNIKTVYIKINNVLIEEMSGFDAIVSTGSSPSNMRAVMTADKTNLVEISGRAMSSYMGLIITMPRNKTIEDIEVYVEYADISEGLTLRHNTSGELTTKIYDIGTAKEIYLSKVHYEGDRFNIAIRGMRQNDRDMIFTDWHDVLLDDKGEATDPYVLRDYEYVQFRVGIVGDDKKTKINHFEVGVIR